MTYTVEQLRRLGLETSITDPEKERVLRARLKKICKYIRSQENIRTLLPLKEGGDK